MPEDMVSPPPRRENIRIIACYSRWFRTDNPSYDGWQEWYNKVTNKNSRHFDLDGARIELNEQWEKNNWEEMEG